MAGSPTRRHPPGGTGRSAPRPTTPRPSGRVTPGLRHRPPQVVPLSRGRLFAVYALLCVALGGLAGRLAWLQIVQGDNLQARARSFQTHAITPLGKRRT
ncbi:MAG: penicillin-binding protein 2, partial [Cyanobium sp.]